MSDSKGTILARLDLFLPESLSLGALFLRILCVAVSVALGLTVIGAMVRWLRDLLMAASMMVLHPVCFGLLMVLWLVGGLTATLSWWRIRGNQPEQSSGGSARVDRAWRIARLNMCLVAANTGLGLVAYAFSNSYDSFEAVSITALAVYTTVLIMLVIFGTYAIGVHTFFSARRSASSGTTASWVLAWSWCAVPLAVVLWIGAVLLFAETITHLY